MSEEKNKKVSIVVPCFNQKQFIAETLDSVAAQTYTDWECLVIDDGSTDGSAALAQRYADKDERFQCFTKPNGGVAEARNFGFIRATGEYFVPLDGDDKLHPDYLKRALECFEREPDTDLVHCKTKRFGKTSKIWRLPAYSYEKMLWRNMVVNTAMFRREAFIKAGGYSAEMRHGLEDWDFYVRMLGPESKVRFINEPLFFYRVGQKSRTTELVDSGRTAECHRLLYARNREKYAPLLENPINTLGKMMQEFSPVYTDRYRRRLRYAHASYGAALAVALAIIAGLAISR